MRPEWDRSCGDCRKWQYDEDGRVRVRAGKPMVRVPISRPPCHLCPKILYHGDEPGWERAADFTPQLEQAIRHAEQCLAVGDVPTDPIVREVVTGVVEGRRQADRVRQERLSERIVLAAMRRGAT